MILKMEMESPLHGFSLPDKINNRNNILNHSELA
jgi:hypothetical protein